MSPVGITEQDVQQMLAITREHQDTNPSHTLP